MKKNGDMRRKPARVKDKAGTIQNVPHVVAQMGYTHGYNLKPRPILRGPRAPCLQWMVSPLDPEMMRRPIAE